MNDDPVLDIRGLTTAFARQHRPFFGGFSADSDEDSAIARAVKAMRKRTPGGSFICPKTITVSFITPDSFISR